MTAKALRQREDIDFMSETAAAAMQGPPAYSHAIIWATFAAIAAFVVWAAYANIGETTVGEGKVIPSTQIQVVQNLEGGIVSEIRVKVGDVVQKNQVVMVIDESSGGDALVARKDRLASLDDLKTRSDYRIAFTAGSPSEYLLKAVAVHFDVPPLRNAQGAWRVGVKSSAEALKQLRDGKVDAAVLWEPDVSRALTDKGVHRVLGTENTRRRSRKSRTDRCDFRSVE